MLNASAATNNMLLHATRYLLPLPRLLPSPLCHSLLPLLLSLLCCVPGEGEGGGGSSEQSPSRPGLELHHALGPSTAATCTGRQPGQGSGSHATAAVQSCHWPVAPANMARKQHAFRVQGPS